MMIGKVFVKQYLRRHPKTPEAVVRNGVRILKKLGADENLKHACYVQVSEEDSQVMEGRGGFRRGACTIVNVELGDTHDEIESATTLFHEGIHARDIAKNGESGVTKENEVSAHWETIDFLRDWKEKESREKNRPEVIRRLDEEIEEELTSIKALQEEDGDD